MSDSQGGPHVDAADAFVRRVEAADVNGVERLLLFGSAARQEAVGLDSDVDFLVVLDDCGVAYG